MHRDIHLVIYLNMLCTRLDTNFMNASCSGLPHLEEAAGEGETGADKPLAGDLAREDGGGAGDRPRPGLRPLTRCLRQVSVMALSSAPSSLLSSCCSRVWSLPTAKERRACNESLAFVLYTKILEHDYLLQQQGGDPLQDQAQPSPLNGIRRRSRSRPTRACSAVSTAWTRRASPSSSFSGCTAHCYVGKGKQKTI